jgi:hypothetical protein
MRSKRLRNTPRRKFSSVPMIKIGLRHLDPRPPVDKTSQCRMAASVPTPTRVSTMPILILLQAVPPLRRAAVLDWTTNKTLLRFGRPCSPRSQGPTKSTTSMYTSISATKAATPNFRGMRFARSLLLPRRQICFRTRCRSVLLPPKTPFRRRSSTSTCKTGDIAGQRLLNGPSWSCTGEHNHLDFFGRAS